MSHSLPEVVGVRVTKRKKDPANLRKAPTKKAKGLRMSAKAAYVAWPIIAGEWADEDTGLVIPCKALLDLVPRNHRQQSVR